jgi:hypothetical protein
VGVTVTPSAITRFEGMETITVTGPALTIKGVHPDSADLEFVNQPTAGQTAAVYRLWTIPNSTYTCEWLLDGLAVPGVSACAYALPASAVGKELRVKVTAHRENYIDKTYDLVWAAVLRDYGPVTGVGKISGTPEVGRVLTVTPPIFNPTPTSYTYQWMRNGTSIAGATAKSYTLVADDAGQLISAAIEPHREGYNSPFTETAALRVNRPFTMSPTPTISGTKAVGFTLTAMVHAWNPTPASYSFQWYRYGKPISGATKPTYKTTSADAGHTITVRVTAKKSGYTTTSKTSAAAMILKRLSPTPTPVITGTPKVKHTLTAKTGVWGPGTVTKSYQWYRNGNPIAGATARTYTVQPRDAYTRITIRVTGKKSGYINSSRTATSVVTVGLKYSSCAALLVDYPGGVAKDRSVKGIVAGTYVSAKMYALNASRDGDKDGWACEV